MRCYSHWRAGARAALASAGLVAVLAVPLDLTFNARQDALANVAGGDQKLAVLILARVAGERVEQV